MQFSETIFDANDFPYKFENGRNFVPPTRGKCCFIIQEGDLFDKIKEKIKFGKQYCVKIFMTQMTDNDLNNYHWGDAPNERKFKDRIKSGYISKLTHSIEAQNICHEQNLAPHVLDVVILKRFEKLYPAQITEFIPGNSNTFGNSDFYLLKNKIIEEVIKHNFKPPHAKLISHYDFVNGKLVDFQGFRKDED